MCKGVTMIIFFEKNECLSVIRTEAKLFKGAGQARLLDSGPEIFVIDYLRVDEFESESAVLAAEAVRMQFFSKLDRTVF